MVNVFLFDVSPYIYSSLFGAVAALKIKGSIPKPMEARLLQMAKAFFINKLKTPFTCIGGNCIPVYCYDGKPIRKRELYPAYKENRKKIANPMPFNLKESLTRVAKGLPGYHLTNPQEEADDILASAKAFIKNTLQEPCTFYVFSTDNDLLQLGDDNTVFINCNKWGEYKDKEYLKKEFNGIEKYKQVVLHKICFGDSSDNITGIFKGARRQAITDEFKKCRNMGDFMSMPKIEASMIPEIKTLYKLIKLNDNVPYDVNFVEDSSEFNCKVDMIDIDLKG